MLLIHRSRRAANAVRTMSAGEELFVASIVVCMLLAAFGNAVDPAFVSELGFEFALFDFGGEFTVLAMSQWHLVQFLLVGGGLVAALAILRVCGPAFLTVLHPAPTRGVEKVPIRF